MKKINSLMIALVCGLLFLTLTGCGGSSGDSSSSTITSEDFTAKMEEKDFDVINVTVLARQFVDTNYIEEQYRASRSDYAYNVEFTKLKNSDDAIKYYDQGRFPGDNAEIETDSEDKDKKETTYKGKYTVISRVGNTVISAEGKEEFKDEINEVVTSLGY